MGAPRLNPSVRTSAPLRTPLKKKNNSRTSFRAAIGKTSRASLLTTEQAHKNFTLNNPNELKVCYCHIGKISRASLLTAEQAHKNFNVNNHANELKISCSHAKAQLLIKFINDAQTTLSVKTIKAILDDCADPFLLPDPKARALQALNKRCENDEALRANLSQAKSQQSAHGLIKEIDATEKISQKVFLEFLKKCQDRSNPPLLLHPDKANVLIRLAEKSAADSRAALSFGVNDAQYHPYTVTPEMLKTLSEASQDISISLKKRIMSKLRDRFSPIDSLMGTTCEQKALRRLLSSQKALLQPPGFKGFFCRTRYYLAKLFYSLLNLIGCSWPRSEEAVKQNKVAGWYTYDTPTVDNAATRGSMTNLQ